MNDKLNTRVSKIKTHFRERKGYYITGIICTAGTLATCLFLAKRADMDISQGINQNLSYKPQAHQTIVATFEEKANLSKPVHWIEKDLYFPSQNSTARETGINPTTLSQHLNGKRDNVNGNHFERIEIVDTPV